jgi:hypothetical protein
MPFDKEWDQVGVSPIQSRPYGDDDYNDMVGSFGSFSLGQGRVGLGNTVECQCHSCTVAREKGLPVNGMLSDALKVGSDVVRAGSAARMAWDGRNRNKILQKSVDLQKKAIDKSGTTGCICANCLANEGANPVGGPFGTLRQSYRDYRDARRLRDARAQMPDYNKPWSRHDPFAKELRYTEEPKSSPVGICPCETCKSGQTGTVRHGERSKNILRHDTSKRKQAVYDRAVERYHGRKPSQPGPLEKELPMEDDDSRTVYNAPEFAPEERQKILDTFQKMVSGEFDAEHQFDPLHVGGCQQCDAKNEMSFVRPNGHPPEEEPSFDEEEPRYEEDEYDADGVPIDK